MRRSIPFVSALLVATLAMIALALTAPVMAQTYPSRTVTLVVPYPPGGGVDAMARIVAEKLSAALGQQVVVDNRARRRGPRRYPRGHPKAAPDGYTLFLGHTGSISINPSLYANAGLRPAQGFRADRADRLDAGRADRASIVPGQDA